MTDNPTKRCKKCGEVKPLDAFSRHKRTKDGRESQCKVCRRDATASWRVENAAHVKSYYASWYTANRGRAMAACKSWRTANPEKAAAATMAWRAANAERLATTATAYVVL
jgi:hypothetical protein